MFSSDIDVDEIKKRIAEFRQRATIGISDEDCINQIIWIFGDNHYSHAVEWRYFEVGTKFYRARSLPANDVKFPIHTIRKIDDAWEPPINIVTKQGRLNAKGQSILYCCANDPDLAIDEARARSQKYVALMVYTARTRIQVAAIGSYGLSNLPKDELSALFYSFLEEEFSHVVTEEADGRYSITRAIAESFFNYPQQDAWCYRSVQSPDKFNVAFLPERSKECLDLVGVMLCDLSASSAGIMNVRCVVDFDNVTGDARYHEIGSREQKLIFPDIE